ncbi:unnamed protein product [Urochloa humidicola]
MRGPASARRSMSCRHGGARRTARCGGVTGQGGWHLVGSTSAAHTCCNGGRDDGCAARPPRGHGDADPVAVTPSGPAGLRQDCCPCAARARAPPLPAWQPRPCRPAPPASSSTASAPSTMRPSHGPSRSRLPLPGAVTVASGRALQHLRWHPPPLFSFSVVSHLGGARQWRLQPLWASQGGGRRQHVGSGGAPASARRCQWASCPRAAAALACRGRRCGQHRQC